MLSKMYQQNVGQVLGPVPARLHMALCCTQLCHVLLHDVLEMFKRQDQDLKHQNSSRHAALMLVHLKPQEGCYLKACPGVRTS